MYASGISDQNLASMGAHGGVPVPVLVSGPAPAQTRVAHRGLTPINERAVGTTAAATAHYGYGMLPQEKEIIDKPLGIDAPSFRSLSGLIISLVLLMNCLSLFICLGRADFNIVFYIFGYYIWCMESEAVIVAPFSLRDAMDRGSFLPPAQDERSAANFQSSWMTYYLCTRRMYRSVSHYNVALLVASAVDISWLLLAFSTWFCEEADPNASLEQQASAYLSPTWCFTGENRRMALLFGMHKFVIYASIANLCLKLTVVILSYVWLSAERKYLFTSEAATETSVVYR